MIKKALLAVTATLVIRTFPAFGQAGLVSHGGANGNTGNITVSLGTTGASLLTICARPSLSFTSSLGNTFVETIKQTGGYNGTNMSMYLSFNPTTGSETITGPTGQPFDVAAYSNVASGPDKTAIFNGLNPPLTIGPVTPTNNNELIISCANGQYYNISSPTMSSTYTNLDFNYDPTQTPQTLGVADSYIVQTTAAATSTTWSGTFNNGQAGLLGTFYSTLSPAPLTVATVSPLPEGVVGVGYTTQYSIPGTNAPVCLKTNGGVNPVTWSLVSGTIPAGLSFNFTTGCFSNTAAPSGAVFQSPLVFKATDAQSHVANSATLLLTVVNTALSLGTSTCPAGTQNTAYAGCSIAGIGGTGTYTYAISQTGDTYLPEGMQLNLTTGAITSARIHGQGGYHPTMTVSDTGGGIALAQITFAITGDNSAEDVHTLLPPDHVVRVRADQAPLDTNAYANLQSASAQHLRAEFGPSYVEGGMPINTVLANQPLIAVKPTDPGQYPGTPPYFFYSELTQTFTDCDAAVEGYSTSWGNPPGTGTGTATGNQQDNHMLTYRLGGAVPAINELYQGYPNYSQTFGAPGCTFFGSGGFGMFGGAVQWDPTTYTPRGDGISGADAGGLSLTYYLLKYDEVINGPAGHAIRATFQNVMKGHLFPATVQPNGVSGPSGGGTNANTLLINPSNPPTAYSGIPPTQGSVYWPPLGAIYRLKSTTAEPAACSGNPIMHNVFLTLKQYGIINADIGISIALVGTQDARWPPWATENACLNPLLGTDLEMVNIQPMLANWPNSYQLKASTTNTGTKRRGHIIRRGHAITR